MLGQVTLYVDGYFTNPFDATCFVALEEKRVPYTTSRAILRDNQGFPQQYQHRAGIPRVPAFQHGDFWLTESLAIAEYIEDVFAGTPLFPADARCRARTRQIMAWLRSDLRELRLERSFTSVIYRRAEPVPALGAVARRHAEELLDLVVWLSERGELVEWNIAHVDLAFALMRIRDDVELPAVAQRLLDANVVRPSVRSYMEHPRPPNPPPYR